jgi:hypothetical protein
MLSGTLWEQPFMSYDLRVNGAVNTVGSADVRSQRRQDLIVISRTGTFRKEADLPRSPAWEKVRMGEPSVWSHPHPAFPPRRETAMWAIIVS